MIPSLRREFNHRYHPEDYPRLLDLPAGGGWRPDRVSSRRNAMLLPGELMHQAAAIGAELTSMLVGNPAYLHASAQSDSRGLPNARRNAASAFYDRRLRPGAGGQRPTRTAAGRAPGLSIRLRLPIAFSPIPIEMSSISTNLWTTFSADTPKPASGSSIPRWYLAAMIPRTSFSAKSIPFTRKRCPIS